jgi:hypothetical protein
VRIKRRSMMMELVVGRFDVCEKLPAGLTVSVTLCL